MPGGFKRPRSHLGPAFPPLFQLLPLVPVAVFGLGELIAVELAHGHQASVEKAQAKDEAPDASDTDSQTPEIYLSAIKPIPIIHLYRTSHFYLSVKLPTSTVK